MNKFLLTGLFCLVILLYTGEQNVFAQNTLNKAESAKAISISDSQDLKQAIEAYKNGNYLTCISMLKEYTSKNPDNAVAWYYLGNSYMNVSVKKEAVSAFDKVEELNTIPKLTSYAIQAKLCIENPVSCKYENFNDEDVEKLKANPISFINSYYENLAKKSIKSDDVIQIENLINGQYAGNMHPEAHEFILNEKTKIEAAKINSGN